MSDKGAGRRFEILLVEDNPGDAYLAIDALEARGALNRVHWVQDGMQAMAFMRREGAYVDSPRPDLVLLDLNLPKKDGRDVLKEIKEDAELKNTPVTVLSISRAEEDIIECYSLHANCYIIKPLDVTQFDEILRAIETFWFGIAALPSDGKKK